MATLSAYELMREKTIAANRAQLAALGLEEAAKACRTQAEGVRKRPRAPAEPKPPPAPSSRSSRSRGSAPELGHVPAELDDRTFEADEDGDSSGPHAERLKQPSNHPRLTKEQMEKLDALEPVSSDPLVTDAELAALELVQREDLRGGKGWQDAKKRNVSLWGEKRTILQEAAPKRGLRWPTWLAEIEASLPPMGSTQTARDQTMYAIMRAACGLGLDYHGWPAGVGVLLSRHEGIPARPRLLTLGADTEKLKREGQYLEHRYGRDAGNGWAYNHALGKLRLFQEKLLKEKWGEVPSAPSIRELEGQIGIRALLELEEEKGWRHGRAPKRGDDEDEDEEDAPLASRRTLDKAAMPPPPTAGLLTSSLTTATGPTAGYLEGQGVEVLCSGDQWRPARVDNVNVEEGTYDIVFDGEGEDDEEGVAADRLRARPRAL